MRISRTNSGFNISYSGQEINVESLYASKDPLYCHDLSHVAISLVCNPENLFSLTEGEVDSLIFDKVVSASFQAGKTIYCDYSINRSNRVFRYEPHSYMANNFRELYLSSNFDPEMGADFDEYAKENFLKALINSNLPLMVSPLTVAKYKELGGLDDSQYLAVEQFLEFFDANFVGTRPFESAISATLLDVCEQFYDGFDQLHFIKFALKELGMNYDNVKTTVYKRLEFWQNTIFAECNSIQKDDNLIVFGPKTKLYQMLELYNQSFISVNQFLEDETITVIDL